MTNRRHPRGRGTARACSVFLVAIAVVLLWAGVAWAASASIVHRGPTDRKQIALTFDDNYNVTRSLATLRALQRHQVPATLFVIGSPVNAFPTINTEIVKGMVAGLFEVGDHSFSHPNLTRLSTTAMAGEIGGGTDAFRRATGARTVPLFRPPYGATNAQVAAVAGSRGFRHLVLWSIDPRDWAGGSASAIANHVIGHAHNGGIVVMHLSAAHTAAAIPTIVETLRARGYEFVTVSTMLKGNRDFLDVEPGTPAGQAIARLVGVGVLSGYDGNYFGPTDTITRAQVAKVATLVGGLDTGGIAENAPATFSDVPMLRDPQGNRLPYPFVFVETAAAAGLVVGRLGPDGRQVFEPHAPITRLQLAHILARMARELKGYRAQPDPETAVFTDVPAYAAEDVSLVAGLGLMTGYAGQKFDPFAGAQRAHVALVMSRYLDLPEAGR
jgi:peptidoglycan/xylan/chitin deacetylase (PgdA/CDA1 family)